MQRLFSAPLPGIKHFLPHINGIKRNIRQRKEGEKCWRIRLAVITGIS